MKITYLSLLVAVTGASLSFGASITGLTPSYTKGEKVYDGTAGDSLNTTGTTLSTGTTADAKNKWTMALTISGLSVTQTGKTGLLFTYNTKSNYKNLEGMGYQLTADGALTLCVGGYNYNGVGSGGSNDYPNSPWKTQVLLSSGYSAATSQPLTLFYTFSQGTVSIHAIWGNGASAEVTEMSSLSSSASFSKDLTKINFSAKDTSGSTWNAPNGVTGAFTLNNFDVYNSILTDAQMKEYAASAVPAVPEPAAASLSLIGLAALLMRRKRA